MQFIVTPPALFKFSGEDPYADATTLFVILTAIYGVVFSFIVGLVTGLIARTGGQKENYVLRFIIVGLRRFRLVKSGRRHWTHLLVIFIFAPVAF